MAGCLEQAFGVHRRQLEIAQELADDPAVAQSGAGAGIDGAQGLVKGFDALLATGEAVGGGIRVETLGAFEIEGEAGPDVVGCAFGALVDARQGKQVVLEQEIDSPSRHDDPSELLVDAFRGLHVTS
jgi:hypothetical protein